MKIKHAAISMLALLTVALLVSCQRNEAGDVDIIVDDEPLQFPKLLRVEHESSTGLSYISHFTYTGNLLTGRTRGKEEDIYTYTGNTLKRHDVLENGVLIQRYDYTLEGEKQTILYTYYDPLRGATPEIRERVQNEAGNIVETLYPGADLNVVSGHITIMTYSNNNVLDETVFLGRGEGLLEIPVREWRFSEVYEPLYPFLGDVNFGLYNKNIWNYEFLIGDTHEGGGNYAEAFIIIESNELKLPVKVELVYKIYSNGIVTAEWTETDTYFYEY